MEVQRVPGPTSELDVLDRVLDKGIVIDAWVRLSLVGIDLVTAEARVVVASIATYLQYSEPLGAATMFARSSSAARLASSFARAMSEGGGRPARQHKRPSGDPRSSNRRRICALCGRAFAVVLPPREPEREGDRLCPECAGLPEPPHSDCR